MLFSLFTRLDINECVSDNTISNDRIEHLARNKKKSFSGPKSCEITSFYFISSSAVCFARDHSLFCVLFIWFRWIAELQSKSIEKWFFKLIDADRKTNAEMFSTNELQSKATVSWLVCANLSYNNWFLVKYQDSYSSYSIETSISILCW